MTITTTDRERLREFVPYEEGKFIREKLHREALKNYKPKYPELYLQYMNANECSFDVNGAQCQNHPYYLTLFSVASQHVMGDCVEECLDKAIEVSKFKPQPLKKPLGKFHKRRTNFFTT
jgi:ferredoxin